MKKSVCSHERLPRACLVIYAITAVSAILYAVFTRSPSFADWFNHAVSRWGRRLLSTLTVWFPFSLAEMLLILSPVLLAFLIVRIVRVYSASRETVLSFLGRVAAAICFVVILFVWCFAPGYYGKTLDRKLGLSREPVSAEELYQTALLLTNEINPLAENLLVNGKGSSVMPYSIGEMNAKLMKAYKVFTADRAFPDCFYSRVKPVMLSEAMSYTHITGVYSFFTGEANINVAFPDYCIPFTAAHELAHQRGIAREDEANFAAFLVCLASEDPYIRYSGLLNVYEYVANALASADAALFKAAFAELNDVVIGEERAYAVFFEKYRDNPAANVSEKTNDIYLQSQGAKEGTRSYDMVVDLTVAYYRPQIPVG
ncbi:MAG: DUF3810 domain-containing protein [Clostridia bacterium]|nr:DUF3810 domain-containing protein [Clostridia bacterium]